MKTVCLFGSSGLVGSELLNQLILRNDIALIQLYVRQIPKMRDRKIEYILFDFANLERVLEQNNRADYFFSTMGSTLKKAKTREEFFNVDFHLPMRIARFAFDHQIKYFSLISSSGANESSPFFYLRVKGMLENGLTKIGLRHLCILRPSFLLGERKDRRILEYYSSRFVSKFRQYLPRNLSPVTAEAVAKSMILNAFNSNQETVKIVHNDEIKKFD
jgi:uncharacterized protein YbjT (DUF2867 family)